MTKWILIVSILMPTTNNTVDYEYPHPEIMKSVKECEKLAQTIREPLIVRFTCKEVQLNAQENEVSAGL